ncbi:MAG TPA: flagellar biosynthetic protein FliR, partial [Myxococcota bacterium]|nr:flagellar biosynthetic protein FliR [Myxococcota bacterium]
VAAPVLADAAGTALRTGAELAGPVVLFSFLIHLAISVLGRMAPNLNLFFSVGISANMTGGLAVLMLAFPTMLLAFLPQLDTMVLRLAQLVGVGG